MTTINDWMGHSGGEVGFKGFLLEDDVTKYATEVSVAYIKSCGHKVVTDGDKMTLQQRINASQNGNPIIEWHANSGGGQGTEVWISKLDRGTQSEKVAKAITAKATSVGFKNRDVKTSDTNRYESLGILDNTKGTAVLVELFFLDTKSDVDNWNKNKKKIVETYTKAFLEGLGLNSTPKSNKNEYWNQTGWYEMLVDDTFYVDKKFKKASGWKPKKGSRIHVDKVVMDGKTPRGQVQLGNAIRFITLNKKYIKKV